MRFKTRVLAPVVALLASLLVSLPATQSQAKLIEKQNIRCATSTTRSYERLPYASKAYNQRVAQHYLQSKYGQCGAQFACLVKLWNKESGWRVSAHNRSSGAHGIPQALPGSKMAKFGKDWRTNPSVQIQWGLYYISKRYGSPCNALGHSQRTGWYWNKFLSMTLNCSRSGVEKFGISLAS